MRTPFATAWLSNVGSDSVTKDVGETNHLKRSYPHQPTNRERRRLQPDVGKGLARPKRVYHPRKRVWRKCLSEKREDTQRVDLSPFKPEGFVVDSPDISFRQEGAKVRCADGNDEGQTPTSPVVIFVWKTFIICHVRGNRRARTHVLLPYDTIAGGNSLICQEIQAPCVYVVRPSCLHALLRCRRQSSLAPPPRAPSS